MRIEVDVKKRLASRGRSFTLDASFCVEGRVVVLFGPSGSGKTLTLQSIAGLIPPDSGRIALDSRVLYDSGGRIDIPSRRRGIGYVFQDYALFPHLTVRENVGFGLKKNWQWRLSRQQRARVELLLDSLEIAHFAGSFPFELSGGQKQRVALARALILEPKLLLLDEPFSALDTALRARLRQELRDIQSRFHIPVIMITHDPEDIKAFAEVLITYNAGHVCDVRSPGSPATSMEDPYALAHECRW